MNEQLEQLEAAVERLAERLASAQKQRQKREEDRSAWFEERKELKARCDAAFARIDTIVAQLQDIRVDS
ncbi:MAG: hypothetical protein F4W90_01485 [Gammaproteobacteria bacterium]|nr:hypothetical protein [Gammaproteobacteria bacterium]